jgi:MFS family permease
MVIGSIVFAAARRAPLALLLLFSTIAVGLGYLGLAAAPTLAAACAASIVGGAGNGVQWVSAISAVQELTAQEMQARVMSVLESIGAAMPGVGYLLGGLIATATDPRITFLVAGVGVLAIVAVAATIMRGSWPQGSEKTRPEDVDAEHQIMVELIPVGGSRPPSPTSSEVGS